MVDDTSLLVTGVDCLGIVKVEFEADDSSGLFFDVREEDCNKVLALDHDPLLNDFLLS